MAYSHGDYYLMEWVGFAGKDCASVRFVSIKKSLYSVQDIAWKSPDSYLDVVVCMSVGHDFFAIRR